VNFFSRLMSKKWIILFGLAFGILGALAVNWGNPANMGICVACFLRDISGALGFHRAGVVQYLRPEIMGFALGGLIAALAFREWRPRGGSSPIIRFVLAMFVMIGALVFLGCPIRMILRLAGGDLNGLTALAGLIFGVLIGIFFLKRGFNLGRSQPMSRTAGAITPAIMIFLLVLAIAAPAFLFQSESGPGSLFMPLALALGIGLFVGFGAQRTRFCSVGAWRDVFMVKDFYLVSGVIALFVGALVTNYIVGNFGVGGIYHWGFDSQPVAHANHLWNFLAMTLLGLAATQLGGCPLRNLVLSGEGDTDAGITILGYIAGAAVAHNFAISASGTGINDWSIAAVIIGLAFCIIIGFKMQKA
jgi:YedE family putative selenium metabolism protein